SIRLPPDAIESRSSPAAVLQGADLPATLHPPENSSCRLAAVSRRLESTHPMLPARLLQTGNNTPATHPAPTQSAYLQPENIPRCKAPGPRLGALGQPAPARFHPRSTSRIP